MRPRKPVYFFAVTLLPVLFFLQSPSISGPIRETSQTLIRPLLQFGTSSVNVVKNIPVGFGRMVKSFKEQGLYEARVQELESQLSMMEELRKENARLKKLLQFSETTEFKSLGARVIGWDPSPWRKTVTVDKGKANGVKVDMAVVVQEGLVGRVIEVFHESARVILMTDPDARASALASESRAQGVVGGTGGAKLEMTYLELDSSISVEEEILTSGIGGLFPKGVPLGKVSSIERDGTGLHLKAHVLPFVDFSKIEEVLLIENGLIKKKQ